MRILKLVAPLCLTLAACHTWQVQPGAPAGALAVADSTKPVRLTLKSGAVLDVSAARVVGDSVVGTSRSTRERVAFAVTDVQSVAQLKLSGGRTALAAGGITTIALALLIVLAAAAVVSSLNY